MTDPTTILKRAGKACAHFHFPIRVMPYEGDPNVTAVYVGKATDPCLVPAWVLPHYAPMFTPDIQPGQLTRFLRAVETHALAYWSRGQELPQGVVPIPPGMLGLGKEPPKARAPKAKGPKALQAEAPAEVKPAAEPAEVKPAAEPAEVMPAKGEPAEVKPAAEVKAAKVDASPAQVSLF
ncbi:MAG: hypothetical protein A2Y78_08485 [Acidobacteria bacterium RBG_13_68_16]|nr:MAG: hypothetical protein A2Y78_08485 [Acidobacteria bacterium RBG_13_68_16]